ncbi:UDP glucuronosyltransferase 5 family, polypeptide G1 [Electrophorus electricus]|uniref:UDP glucuronosyltransferase 5 family, polypeptide G1 n=1 Tax=Electrophorus electricus TaxID=8005 RepID=UPI0015CFE9CE|nr:UDP glucuronosyltransferase 5 family, polypeptide G1 [Electrophorus electricus]XP_035375954.1 UDP glucuronosyltransferase 5 family, polypeptide G1 [Electrophorus electricus]XP_035375955.1 UDP glucuronosyltransferase 5 family, polypeptide G1 [Electrophorus electricus]
MGVNADQFLYFFCLLFVAGSCSAGRILVFPEDGSHWLSMQVILKELHTRGHSLTVVRSSASWYIQDSCPIYTFVTVNYNQIEDVGPVFFETLVQRSLALQRMTPILRFFEQQKDVTAVLKSFHGEALGLISTMLDDASLMGRLQDAKFDLMLTDPAFPAGVLLAHYLHVPMVYNVRWLNAGEAHVALAPSPPSHVPVYNSLFSDRMGILQRTENILRYLVSVLQEHFVILPIYDKLLKRHFPAGSDLLTMQRSADIWLMRVDFIFEFPRPSMPNTVYIGGFQCRPAQPIPAELEDFMQSSAEHGVVVMSLGVMVTSLPKEITEAIAAAFAKLPQKIIWRYLGERPSSLGNNTLLLEWLPQNDLLGHPKTCAFVSHGGTNGIYEAIYHGVPVLVLPLLFDQFDNAVRLEVRGAARVLEVATLTSSDFLEAITDVIKNPTYRSSIQKMSVLHRDRPLSSLDTAIFWIEYVLRHKGAPHLRSEGNNLPWYSYHCLDVLFFLLVIILAALWAAVTLCRLFCCKSDRKQKID